MFNLKINIVLSFFILILVICLVRKYQNKNNENFFSKVNLKKKVILVIMKGTVPNHVYGAISDHTCSKLVKDCSVIYNKDKIGTKKKINITNDVSMKTDSDKKNVTYIIVYKNNKSNKYKKKFMKKWCSESKKDKDNYVLIDYDNALMNSHEIMEEVSSKLDIKFNITDLMKIKL